MTLKSMLVATLLAIGCNYKVSRVLAATTLTDVPFSTREGSFDKARKHSNRLDHPHQPKHREVQLSYVKRAGGAKGARMRNRHIKRSHNVIEEYEA